MKHIKKNIVITAMALVAAPAFASEVTCQKYAAQCAATEHAGRLACALQSYNSRGTRGTATCNTALAGSYYAICKTLAANCSSTTPPIVYDTNTTNFLGGSSTGTVVTINCASGQFLRSLHVRYGSMSSLKGLRVGFLEADCTDYNTMTIASNNTKYGERLACDTGMLITELKGLYNGSYMTALGGNCQKVGATTATYKYMNMIGVKPTTGIDPLKLVSCKPGTYARGITGRINSATPKGDQHLIGVQLNCARYN